ncbi:DUF3592 domain-containing protein [Amycolatopsis rhabdoformis]|uniref:DUF3592 domain-containing protein n=1 Tax=Amycolatopsis rhabdoformis TaxID=1448059 RepID=A0ABZ1IBL3_9PSEU|nr:DUF3592 domain-containing protein [Amycolatopsis rhabdoformis]WSE30964.1 DUF3592 domain-containing protein [Amycolatopsis rhabdoformis]
MRSFLRLRPVRHILVTSAVVLIACAAVFVVQLLEFSAAQAQVRGITAQATATVVRTDDDLVTVRFPVAGGRDATADVQLDSTAPKNGTTVPVLYDPAQPSRALIRDATPIVTADRATTYATVTVVAAAAVLAIDAFFLFTRFLRPARAAASAPVSVRRVKLQRGVLTRSWIETETAVPRWIPVYFSPTLIGLPAPAKVVLHGDVRRDRHVAVSVGDELLYPAGAVRTTEPRGRRTDNPAEPDDERSLAAARPVSLARQFRADLPVLAVAPVVAAFWAFVDGSGFDGWLVVTVLVAAFGFWWAALRGSDPSL